MDKIKPNKGGAREGAGAKIKTCDGKRADKQIRVSYAEAEFIKKARALKLNLDEVIKTFTP